MDVVGFCGGAVGAWGYFVWVVEQCSFAFLSALFPSLRDPEAVIGNLQPSEATVDASVIDIEAYTEVLV